SSRRRHTRSKRDWSSDVCSSDLAQLTGRIGAGREFALERCERVELALQRGVLVLLVVDGARKLGQRLGALARPGQGRQRRLVERSEERRVGREGRSGEGSWQQKE